MAEHERLLVAIDRRTATGREGLMRAHVESAFRHWSDRRPGDGLTPAAAGGRKGSEQPPP